MALMNQVDLKLVLTAQNDAQAFFDDVATAVASMREQFLGLNEIDPFAGLQTAADAAVTTARDAAEQIKGAVSDALSGSEVVAPSDLFAPVQTQATDTATAVRDEFSQALSGLTVTSAQASAMFAPIVSAARDASAQVKDAMQAALSGLTAGGGGSILSAGLTGVTGRGSSAKATLPTSSEILNWFTGLHTGGMTPEQYQAYSRAAVNASRYSGSGLSPDISQFYSQYGGMLGAPTAIAEEAAAARSGGLFSGLGKSLTSLPTTALMGGMNAYMAYFLTQSLAGGAMNFTNYQQMQKLNNMTTPEAVQAMSMLSMFGISGASAPSFLQGLSGNLQTLFTPQIGTGMLSKNAILLESLGINQQDLTASPWMLLQTIGTRYRSLLQQGRGDQASQLLQLTGTSQIAPLLANWQNAQRQTQGIGAGMTQQQLQQAVNSGIKLEASLSNLSLAFSGLAVTIAPLLEKFAGALTDATNALTGHTKKGQASGLVGALEAPFNDLGLAGGGLTYGLLGNWIAKKVTGRGLLPLTGKSPGWLADLFGTAKGAAGAAGSAATETAAGSASAGLMSGLLGPLLIGLGGVGLEESLFGTTTTAKINTAASAGLYGLSGNVFGAALGALQMPGFAKSLTNVTSDGDKEVLKWEIALKSSIGHLSTTVGESVKTWDGELGKSVRSLASTISKDAGSWGTELWGAMARGLRTVDADAGKWSASLWGDIEGGLGSVTKGLSNWASGLWGDIESMLGFGGGGHAAAPASSKTTKGGSSSTSWLGGLWGDVTSAVSGLTGSAMQAYYAAEAAKITALPSTAVRARNLTMFAAGGLINEPVHGIGLSSGNPYLLGEAGPEMVVPMGALGRGGAGAAQSINVSVSVNGNTSDMRQLARMVADEIMTKLNIRGNFDLSF